MSEPLLLTEEQAAERLLMTTRTLRKLRMAGKIRYVALTDRRIAYKLEDCLAYIESRLRQEIAPPEKPRRARAVGNRRSGNILTFSARQGIRG